MTQKESDSISNTPNLSERRKSTRIENAPPDLFDPDEPRLGRRESEPHSAEVTYLHDVLTTNFPDGRALWDLHHYFIGKNPPLKGKKLDLQFDISFFKDLTIPEALPSFDAAEHGGEVPDLVINVLSKSTWRADLSEHVDACNELGIPVYAVFSPYLVTSQLYAPPFIRAYVLQDDGSYKHQDLRDITLQEGEEMNMENVIDISDKLPFRLGLKQLKRKFKGGKALFRVILIDPSEPKVLPTSEEKTKKEAKEMVENAEKEAEEKVKRAEKKVEKLKDELKKYRQKAEKLG